MANVMGEPAALASALRGAGVDVRWIRAVEPSVEDLFVSFVDRERKGRIAVEEEAQLVAFVDDPS